MPIKVINNFKDAAQPWPQGLTVNALLQDLANTKCPTKLGFKLATLKKQAPKKFASVMQYGSNGGTYAMPFMKAIKNGDYEKARAYVNNGVLDFVPTQISPINALIDRTDTWLRNPIKGAPKLRAAAFDLAKAILENNKTVSLGMETLTKIQGTGHPVELAAAQYVHGQSGGQENFRPELEPVVSRVADDAQIESLTMNDLALVPAKTESLIPTQAQSGTSQKTPWSLAAVQLLQELAPGKKLVPQGT